jgi:uncharacterized membrane protein YdbT with pleckstrin-like domain
MAITDKLSEGEHVVLNLRTHAKALAGPVVVLVLAVVVAAVVGALVPEGSSQQWLRLAVWVIAAVVVLVWAVVPFLRWLATRYTITNRRLITRTGLVTRTGRDIPLYRINDVSYEKGLLDRLLGCGTLVISDATEKAGVVLDDIPDVERVQVTLNDLLFAVDDGSDDGEFPPGEPRRPRGRRR